MVDLLQLVPHITVGIVFLMILLILAFIMATGGSPKQAWDVESGNKPLQEGGTRRFNCCCCHRRNRRIAPESKETLLVAATEGDQASQPRYGSERMEQSNNNETNQSFTSEINQQGEAINIEETNSQEAKPTQRQESENEEDNEVSEMINEISSYSNSEPEDEEKEQVNDTSESSTNCPSTPEIGEQERAFESQEAREIIQVLKDYEYMHLRSIYIVDGKFYSSMKELHNDPALIQPHIIYRIWISNSPKKQESIDLLEVFKKHKHKPTLYIGRVYKYTSEDRQGLKELLDAGFKLEMWGNVSREIHQRYKIHIDQYIKSVKKRVGKSSRDRA